jgi:hypothetical protein
MNNMAVYFAGFRPDGSKLDTYSVLLKMLHARGICGQILFSTLNYECLFELAAEQIGLTVHHRPSESSDSSNIRLIKLHGSCNYVIPPEQNIVFKNAEASLHGIAVGEDYTPIRPADVKSYVTERGVPPAMCVYMQSKPVDISRPTIRLRQQEWRKYVSQASRVIIIGVKPSRDGHIWEPLSQTSARVYFVGNRDLYLKWSSQRRRKLPTNYVDHYFFDAIKRLVGIIADDPPIFLSATRP